MMARVIEMSNGRSSPGLEIVRAMSVSTGPRIFSTASASVSPRTCWPSIRVMKSPALTPAR